MKKNILITGTSSGIGRAAAELFAQKGWNVVATMRNKENGDFLNKYPNVLVTELDVTKQEIIDRALEEAIKKFGKIDVLLNNAGLGCYGIFEDASEDMVEKQFDTNLFGVMRMIKSILPYFRENKDKGMIINVTSVGGRVALPGFSLYYASKWAVEGLSEALKFELMPIGIKVKIIEPGIVNTSFNAKSYDFSKHILEEYNSVTEKAWKVLLKLSGYAASEPVKIAEVIYTAATDNSDRLRYPAGLDAEAFMKIRNQLSDEEFFSLIIKEIL